MLETITTHITANPIGDTGHLRPTIALITNIAFRQPHVLFTVFILKTLVAKVKDEVQRSGIPQSAIDRIRVIGISDIDFQDGEDRLFEGVAITEINKCVPDVYKMLVAGGQVTCTATGIVYDYADVPLPKVSFSDLLSPYVGEAIKRLAPQTTLLVVWPTPAFFFNRMNAPKEHAGLGLWGKEAKAIAARNPGMSVKEAAMTILAPSGKMLPNHEGVEVWDYEQYPQDSTAGDVIEVADAIGEQVLSIADGVVLPMTESWEPGTARALRDWYQRGLDKKLFFVGQRYQSKALISANHPTTVDVIITARYPEIFNFLDSQTAKSVWLIAFGSIFYPYNHPDHVETVLRTLIKTKTPFILSRSGVMAQRAPMAEEISKAVMESGIGMVVEYLPQEAVLAHPSMGAFITHGGINSLQESVLSGVMPILWPFDLDQSFSAVYLSQKVDCAFELVQVRTGPGALPPHRGGTIVGTEVAIAAEVEQVTHDLRGEIGDRKRRNLAEFRANFLHALHDDVPKALDAIAELAN